MNDDLKGMSELDATLHYKTTGYLEGRKYKLSQICLDYNVYVYCCGKSGSSTLVKTFNNNGYNALHVHGFYYYINNNVESKINNNIFDVIEKSMINNENVYIIDSYRTPIERKLSSFFQNYKYSETNNIDDIIKEIDENILFIENYESINEVLGYFKLPYFESFDFKNKYNILKYKNITFIKLRFEDINEWGDILSCIFNKNIKIFNDNLSKTKIYYDIYNNIIKTYKIPEIMIDNIKYNKEFKIYNSLESQNKYIEYWSKRTKHYLVKYKNVPIDFNPKKYIELNNDLSNFTELDATIHYENHGFIENRQIMWRQKFKIKRVYLLTNNV